MQVKTLTHTPVNRLALSPTFGAELISNPPPSSEGSQMAEVKEEGHGTSLGH